MVSLSYFKEFFLLLLISSLLLPAPVSSSSIQVAERTEHPFFQENVSLVKRRFIVLGDERLEKALELVELRGGRVLDRFVLLKGAIIETDEITITFLKSLGLAIYPDRTYHLIKPFEPLFEMYPQLREATASIGASIAWNMGFEGKGVKVAIIDTGIQNEHPWLIRDGVSVVKWEVDATNTGITDYCGFRIGYHEGGLHGTHIAGIIASQNTDHKGVAPGVDIYDIIVFPEELNCSSTFESILIKGIELALLGPDGVIGTGDEADVINLSLGFTAPPQLQYAIIAKIVRLAVVELLEEAVKRGKVVVVAAGNSFGLNTINVLCLAEGVICVGASSHMGTPEPEDDVLAWFSSKGPGPLGSFLPHVVAPGVYIYSSVPTHLGYEGAILSGTSMATPFVSGASAILINYYKSRGVEWSPAFIRAMLIQTAIDVRPQSVDAFWLLDSLEKEFWRAFVPEPPITTPIDQGGGLIQVHLAITSEVLLTSHNRDQIYVVNNVGKVFFEVIVTNLAYEVVTLKVANEGVLRLVEAYSFKRSVSGVVEPRRIELAPGRSVVLKVLVDVDKPGTYVGYVGLVSENSKRVYRIPVLVVAPIDLDRGYVVFYENVTLATRDAWDIMNVYLRAVRRLEAGTASVALLLSPEQQIPYSVIATAPSGTYTESSYASLLFPVIETGTYTISIYLPVVLTYPNVEGKVYMMVQDPHLLNQKFLLIENRINALQESLAIVESSLNELKAGLAEVRTSVTRVNASVVELKAILKAIENELASVRRDLEKLSREVTDLDKTLSQRIAEEANRIDKLETLASSLRVALEDLENRTKALDGNLKDLEGRLSTLRLISFVALAIGAIGTVVAIAFRFRRSA
ncbi:MAG: S8 family serine peptidase [Acidilobaceae archaeon]